VTSKTVTIEELIMVTIGNTFSASGSQSLAAIKPPVVESTNDGDSDDGVAIATATPTPPPAALAVKPSIVDDYA
jgi:hypothetical protein